VADFKQIAQLFEDRVENVDYYETRAHLRAKNELLDILDGETKQLIFLVGEPGSGKSLFLYNLPKILDEKYHVIRFNTPFFEPVDFIKHLIWRKDSEVGEHALEQLIAQAVELYKESPTIVAIDEAQLLSKDMIELLRILADSKAFWFIMAMHRHESAKILREPQFSSRPHRIIELGLLEYDEAREYIAKELLKAGAYNLEEELSKKQAKTIYKFSKGNFRDTKKLLHRMFLLMDAALKLGKDEFTKPSRCLVTMAAIDGGLVDS